MKQIITSLDIGSSSIKVIVGEIINNELFVLACNKEKSEGIKKGVVTDPVKATSSIKNALKKVEEILNFKIDKVLLSVPSYGVKLIKGEGYTTITRENNTVNGDDITSSLRASVYNRVSTNLELVNVSPVSFVINDNEIVKDPRGKKAYKLLVNSVLTTIPRKNIVGVLSILENLNIKVVDLCLGGLADYYEFYNEDFIKNDKTGAVINVGADKTEVSIISDSILVKSEVLDVGGSNIDKDISYLYDIPESTSKEIKEKYANVSKNKNCVNESFEVINNNEENIRINQYELSESVYSKTREILDLSKKQINLLTKEDISYIIITGGVSECDGFSRIYEQTFGKSCKFTCVKNIGVRSNEYSTCLGIIKMYNEKLRFRDKIATTFTDEATEELFKEKRKANDGSIFGKVYSYFFDN